MLVSIFSNTPAYIKISNQAITDFNRSKVRKNIFESLNKNFRIKGLDFEWKDYYDSRVLYDQTFKYEWYKEQFASQRFAKFDITDDNDLTITMNMNKIKKESQEQFDEWKAENFPNDDLINGSRRTIQVEINGVTRDVTFVVENS